MVFIGKYLEILRLSAEIMRDSAGAEKACARAVYTAVFNRLIASGMPCQSTDDSLIIETDGVTYAAGGIVPYAAKDEGDEKSVPKTRSVSEQNIQTQSEKISETCTENRKRYAAEPAAEPVDSAAVPVYHDDPEPEEITETSAPETVLEEPEEEYPGEPEEEYPEEPEIMEPDVEEPEYMDLDEAGPVADGPDIPEPSSDVPDVEPQAPDMDSDIRSEELMEFEFETEHAEAPQKSERPVSFSDFTEDDGPDGEEGDAAGATQGRERAEEDEKRNAAVAREEGTGDLPSFMEQTGFSFQYIKVTQNGLGGNVKKNFEIVAAPIQPGRQYPDIIACVISNSGKHTDVYKSGKPGEVTFDFGGCRYVLHGRMDGDVFRTSCQPAPGQEDRFECAAKYKKFGTKGHIVLRDTESYTSVHIFPVSFFNNKRGHASFMYYINSPEGESFGDSFGMDTVRVTLAGERAVIDCRWKDTTLYANVTEAAW